MSVIENLTARVERLEKLTAMQTELLKFLVKDYNSTTDALQTILNNLQSIKNENS